MADRSFSAPSVHSGGSAPRSAGAYMAVFADGSTRARRRRPPGAARRKGGPVASAAADLGLRAYDLSEREGRHRHGLRRQCHRVVSLSRPGAGGLRARHGGCVRRHGALLAEARHCRGRQNGRFAFERGGPFPVRGPAGLDAGNACCLYRAAHAAGGASISSARGMSGRRSCRCWNMSALP